MACEQMFIISKYCFNVTYVNVYIMGLLQTVPLSESSKVETVWQSILQVRYFFLDNAATHASVWMSVVAFLPAKQMEMYR